MRTFFALFLLGLFASPLVADNKCPAHLIEAWNLSAKGLAGLADRFVESDSSLQVVATTLLGHGYALLDGPPGGGKSSLPLMLAQAELLNINRDGSNRDIYIQQFHKALTEQVITGFPKIQKLLDTDQYEYDTTDALVGKKYVLFILDEFEKALPSTSGATLSSLAEKKVFLGSREEPVGFRAGFFTSNKNTAGFLNAYRSDRATGEAVLDRMGIKHTMHNKIVDDAEFLKLFSGLDNQEQLEVALTALTPLLNQVTLTRPLLSTISQLIFDLDKDNQMELSNSERSVAAGRAVSIAQVPPNLFSIRSDRTLILDTLRASFLIGQMRKGVPADQIRFEMRPEDLVHLGLGAIYSGPGVLRFERIAGKFEVRPGPEPTLLSFDYVPFESKVLIQNPLIGGETTAWVDWDKNTVRVPEELPLSAEQTERLFTQVADLDSQHATPRSVAQYEDNGFLTRYLGLGFHSKEERAHLEHLLKRRTAFVSMLNNTLRESAAQTPPASKPILWTKAQAISSDTKVDFASLSGDEKLRQFWDLSAKSLVQVKTQLGSLSYVTERIATALVGRQNILLAGPPGGAKTMLAQLMLNAEERGIQNLIGDSDSLTFTLQFNRLTPPDLLRGREKLSAKMKGRHEIETRGTLADDKVLFATLDEIHNASPSTAEAALGPLNEFEREVRHGSVVKKIPLRTAILTSNKMPGEFADGFGNERDSGIAFLDRMAQITLVSNKFDTPDELTDFLEQQLQGQDARQALPPSYYSELTALLKRVEITPTLLLISREILRRYLTARRIASEQNREAFLKNVPLSRDLEITSEGSTRLELMYIKAMKARFLLRQLSAGVAFKDIQWKMTLESVPEATLAWRWGLPHEKLEWVTKGSIPMIENEIVPVDRSHHPPRIQAVFEIAGDQRNSFINSANAVVREFTTAHREEIEKYPQLFPELQIRKAKEKSERP